MRERVRERKRKINTENVFKKCMLFCTDETDARVLIIHLYSNKQHSNSFAQFSTEKKKNIYNRTVSFSKSVIEN